MELFQPPIGLSMRSVDGHRLYGFIFVLQAMNIKADDYATLPLFSPSESDNRLLNEFFLYVLEDFHTGQSLGALKITSDDP